MKLRQKLAAVLAASMVVTAVPVTTFAASTNKLSHRVAARKGTITGTAENELATSGNYNRSLRLEMDFGKTITSLPTSFYVETEDVKFLENEYKNYALNAFYENGVTPGSNGEYTLGDIVRTVDSQGQPTGLFKLATQIGRNFQTQFDGLTAGAPNDFTLGNYTLDLRGKNVIVKDVKIKPIDGKLELTEVLLELPSGAIKANTAPVDQWFTVNDLSRSTTGLAKVVTRANDELKAMSELTLKDTAVVVGQKFDASGNPVVQSGNSVQGLVKRTQLEEVLNKKLGTTGTGGLDEKVKGNEVPLVNTITDLPFDTKADGTTPGGGQITTSRSAINRIIEADATLRMVIEFINDTTLRVSLVGDSSATYKTTKISVPIFAKIDTDNKVPYVTVRDYDSFATNGKYALTDGEVDTDKRLTATIDKDLKLTVDGGEIGKITVKEREEHAIKNAAQANEAIKRLDEIAYELEGNLTSSEMSALKNERKAIMNDMKYKNDDYTLSSKDNRTNFKDEQFIYVKLPKNSDLKFSKTQDAKLVGKYAFAPNEIKLERKNASNYKDDDKAVYDFVDEDYAVDYQTLRIRLPKKSMAGTTTGEWEIKGLDVEPEDAREEAVVGDFTLTVKGDMLKTLEEKLTVVDYGTSLLCEKPVALVAGKESKEVEVVLKEDVTDSLDDKRWVTFILPEGMYIKADREYVKNDNIKDLVTVKIGSDEISKDGYALTNVVKNIDGDIIGFKLELEYKDDDGNLEGYLKQGEVNKVTMKFNVQAATNFKPGEALITAESRAFANDKDAKDNKKSVKIADVTAPVEAKFETTEVKVGLEKQAGKKITIKETDKNMLEKGLLYVELTDGKIASKREDIKLSVNDGSTLDAEVKAIKDGIMTIEVKRQSKEASELTIDGLVYTIDRTVPEGGIDLELYGPALRSYDGVWADTCYNDAANRHNNQKSAFVENIFCCYEEDEHRLNFDKVIDVPTKNTEDIGSASGKAVEAKFVIGSNKYTVNGEEKTMDAAAFAQDGRTMIPVRFLCEALGLPGDALSYSGKNIAIVTNDRAIGLTAGSKTMMVDGVPVQMSAATVVKNGRTYAPVSEIARALGLTSNWDAASKTATFTK